MDGSDEIDLVDYVKVIVKRKGIILSIIAVGVAIAFITHFDNVDIYQAIGHYKGRQVNKQFIEEAKIKYPQSTIEGIAKTKIVIIKEIHQQPDVAIERCHKIAKELRLKKIADISYPKTIDSNKMKIGTTIFLFAFFGICIGFIQERWYRNKGVK